MAHGFWGDAQVGCGQREIARVPEEHGGGDEVQAGGAVSLVLEGAVAQLAELAEEDSGLFRASLSALDRD